MFFEYFFRDAFRTDPGGDFFQIYHSGFDVRYGLSIYENYTKNNNKKLIKQINKDIPFHPPNRYLPIFAFTVGVFLSYF